MLYVIELSGVDERKHDVALLSVFRKAEEFGIKFNKNKFQFKLSQVSFMGQIIPAEGVKPDSKHVDAIMALKNPSNQIELLIVLGMSKFLCKFIPNMSQITPN